MIEQIIHNDQLFALILRADYRQEGISFFTPNEFSQQLGYMNRPAGHRVTPHLHNPVARQVHFTSEVLFVKSGRVRADFFDHSRHYLESRVLTAGDVILLAAGGHGFEMLEASEIIEVKQGPYTGEEDKTHFQPDLPETPTILGPK